MQMDLLTVFGLIGVLTGVSLMASGLLRRHAREERERLQREIEEANDLRQLRVRVSQLARGTCAITQPVLVEDVNPRSSRA
jgi:hypothetical protein